MSIKFDNPVNDEAKAMMEDIFGKPQFQDRFVSLYDRSLLTNTKELTRLANVAEQPVRVVMYDEGDVVTLEDGISYRCTLGFGWVVTEKEFWICDHCQGEMDMDHKQIIVGMRQYCSDICDELGRKE